MVNIVTVDNTDTVHLSYDHKWFFGNWTDKSTSPPSSKPLLASNDLTAQIVMKFPVNGTGFSYYGLRRTGGARYRICVDCNPVNPTGPFDIIDALDTRMQNRNTGPPVLLYTRQGLSNGPHTVVLMNTNDTREHPQGVSHLTLDRFEITTPGPFVGAGRYQSVYDRLLDGSVEGGVIAGVVLAIIALLSAFVVLFLWWHRRRRIIQTSIEEGKAGIPDPFIIRPGGPSTSSGSTFSLMSSLHNSASIDRKGRPHTSSFPDSEAAPTAPSSRGTTRRVEEDAGPVDEDAGPVDEDEDTLPPDYAQVLRSRSMVLQPSTDPLAAPSNRPPTPNSQ